jgi:hypothetical protein
MFPFCNRIVEVLLEDQSWFSAVVSAFCLVVIKDHLWAFTGVMSQIWREVTHFSESLKRRIVTRRFARLSQPSAADEPSELQLNRFNVVTF